MWISRGTKADWAYFAGWHYRGHGLGFVKFMTVLWDGEEPVGMCVFVAPAKSLTHRNRYFGLTGRWSRLGIRAISGQLVTLSRVVLHPTYRGAGNAAAFVRRSCELCGSAWVEALAAMGEFNPFFERAGFVRVGQVAMGFASLKGHAALYGGTKDGRQGRIRKETFEKSQYARPVYYIFDNRHEAGDGARGARKRTEGEVPEGAAADAGTGSAGVSGADASGGE